MITTSPHQPTAKEKMEDGHEWNWVRGAWRCKQCLKSTRNKLAKVGRCQGAPPSLSRAWRQASMYKHSLRAAADDAGDWLMYCTHCGGWASQRAVKLAGRCSNKPSKQGTTVLNRISSGRHPVGCQAAWCVGEPLQL